MTTAPHCTIIERRDHYVTFWEQLDERTRVYRFSDNALEYSVRVPALGEAERRRDAIAYQRETKLALAEDPFVGRAVHS